MPQRVDPKDRLQTTIQSGGPTPPQGLVWLGFDGSREGRWPPSSEWHFHQAQLRAWPALHATVHTHTPFATALACLRRELPALDCMVAEATKITMALESLCRTYLAALALAESTRHSAEEMAVLIERFSGYRQPHWGEA